MVAEAMDDSGLGGLIRTAAWCDDRLGMEVISIGRSAFAKEDCALELCGGQLVVRVTIRGSWVWVSACSMDEADQPELLFNIGDGPEGWITVRRFIQAVERSGIKSLKERPVQIGEPGSEDSFLIG